MGLEGLGKDDLKRVLEIRSAIGDVKSAITAGNAELKKLGQSFTNLNTEVNKVASEAKSFAELQDKAAESAKATTEAIKKEAQQLSIVRTLNLEINKWRLTDFIFMSSGLTIVISSPSKLNDSIIPSSVVPAKSENIFLPVIHVTFM